MENKSAAPNDIKKIFMKKGACSHTGYFVLNREFGYNKPNEERASDLLAGGLANRGYQCGMLWGCSLAIGAECFRKCNDLSISGGAAVTIMEKIIASFVEKTGTPDCRLMTKCDFSKPWGLIKYMILYLPKGLTNSICFNVAEQWLPVAAEMAEKEISERETSRKNNVISCASQVVKMAGGSDEECATVAGFAGGLGLSGNACGALAAVIWFRLLLWCRDNPGKTLSYFNNKIVNKHLKYFLNVTHKEMVCSKICGKKFTTVEEHSDFIKQGGCARIIEAISNV
ncbi:MAG TPA: C-GCAxxG-C-C family (seleno)protein [Chitinispirillaceae bacterium]|nr:C-GCAxxG-C-C family (seleno)protein [Chitinispirillaceae bacterium]